VSGPGQAVSEPPVTIISLLSRPDFRRLWAVGAYSGVVRWVEMLAVGIYVYDVTGSPTLVVAFSLLRWAIPLTRLSWDKCCPY
jgi:hypothetical protein